MSNVTDTVPRFRNMTNKTGLRLVFWSLETRATDLTRAIRSCMNPLGDLVLISKWVDCTHTHTPTHAPPIIARKESKFRQFQGTFSMFSRKSGLPTVFAFSPTYAAIFARSRIEGFYFALSSA